MIDPNTTKGVQDFRKIFRKFFQLIIGGKYVKPVAMVNKGYIHLLNASYDGLLLRETRAYSLLWPLISVIFGTIQPCIRIEDQKTLRKSPLHLSLFEILGYSILQFEDMTPEVMAEKTIKEFMIYFTEFLRLDPDLLRVYYFGGGTLREASKGIVKSDEYIKPDEFSVELWRSYGVEDLVAEYSNETFLLHLGKPYREHHAGYRNDIFMKVSNSCYEIATLNFISHQTIMENREIIGISKLPFYLREMAVGQERLLAAIQGSENLDGLPLIAPLVENTSLDLSEEQAITYIDALRAVHYIVSDGWTYDTLRGHKYKYHRSDLNELVRVLWKDFEIIGEQKISELLQKNAELQPWYPKLETSGDQVIDMIKEYARRRRKAK